MRREEEEKKKPPSLRRHYPVQVLRVLSQPLCLLFGKRVSTPGTFEAGFPPAVQRYETGRPDFVFI